jgi:aminoglycoside phosphotransferase (APT) family kinase protein
LLIDAQLVRALVREQFPPWADLDVRPLEPAGWDNRSFRLGEDLVARLPSGDAYAPQVDKEHHWLPRLAPHLPLTIPTPIAMGVPGSNYPWPWSIHRWIDGQSASGNPIDDPSALARDLGGFLAALQVVDTAGGPAPGDHNFHRGDDLQVYDEEVDRALGILKNTVDHRAAGALWGKARATHWQDDPVWIHGDVSPGNLLLRSGRLAAVIDFGNLGVGDPACDLAIAWTWFDAHARKAFRSRLRLDEATWLRGRAWALWKALIVAAGMTRTNSVEYALPQQVIERCLASR